MLALAKEILKKEAQAILRAADYLDDSFCEIARIILQSKGNIIITGVGKSGIVGRKISASFASCQIKSFFIHTAELMHGDLGNICENDVVILISFSGKSEEVLKVMPFLQRKKPKLISISKSDSPLATLCELNIPTDCSEAIDDIPAPTSSTTLTLALADALLGLILKLKDFKASDFAINHPGGALGKKYYLKIKDLMHKENLPLINQNSSLKDAIISISKSGFGCALIIDENEKLLAFLSDGDLRRAMSCDDFSLNEKALKYANKNPKTSSKDILASKAFAYMKEQQISILVITEDDKIIGLLKLLDE